MEQNCGNSETCHTLRGSVSDPRLNLGDAIRAAER